MMSHPTAIPHWPPANEAKGPTIKRTGKITLMGVYYNETTGVV